MPTSSKVKLHLISLDVPYPPDYGGMIDVYYKIKHLHEVGVEIYLHCFQYGRPQQEILEQYCKEVWYYPRRSGLSGLSLTLPYMMFSRRASGLLPRLLAIDAPILFEGVHTTFLLNHPELKTRKKIIRNQNVEQQYFRLLGKNEHSLFRKMYYQIEWRLLRRLENNLNAAHAFFTVSLHDYDFFKTKYPRKHHYYLPSFQSHDTVVSKTGTGDYIIYHGNLGHVENQDALMWLAENVFPKLTHKIVIAGKNPSYALQQKLSSFSNVRLIPNPDLALMQKLIQEAHIHLLPTFQASGLKLKLVNALYSGRHIVVNKNMLHGTGLQELCSVAESPEEFITLVNELMAVAVTEKMLENRKNFLQQAYSNRQNALRILQYLQGMG